MDKVSYINEVFHAITTSERNLVHPLTPIPDAKNDMAMPNTPVESRADLVTLKINISI